MTNKLFIDIDTDRESPIKISHSDEDGIPQTPEETKALIMLDLESLEETLITLIHITHINQFGDRTELVQNAIQKLSNYLNKYIEYTEEATPTAGTEAEG